MPLIRLDKISVNFGTQIILDEITLTIKRGQKFGLLGRNGTGKSTLMKLISGDIMPDDGERWCVASPTRTLKLAVCDDVRSLSLSLSLLTHTHTHTHTT